MNKEGPIHCDVTELLGNPIRTGIQRVVREALRHWSSERELRLCRFDGARGTLVEVPREALYYLLEHDERTRNASVEEIRTRIADLIAQADIHVVPKEASVLIPEVFYDEARCRHYFWRLEANPAAIAIIFYDFIPYLHPDMIGVTQSRHLMWYALLACKAARAAFISDATRRDWQKRIAREEGRVGVVLPLGSDGLKLERQLYDKRKQDFVAIGSIDGRKNQLSVLAAFQALWDEGVEANLVFVGRVFASEENTLELLAEAEAGGRFRHIPDATDDDIADILRDARATIYASVVEGFGLPPVESLHAGIPCIVGAWVPSVEHLADKGVVELRDPSPEAIVDAVRLMLPDEAAERYWRQAGEAVLPTWQDFGREVSTWVTGAGLARDPRAGNPAGGAKGE